MKKNLIFATVVIIFLTGCNSLKQDREHATVTLTTSNEAYVWESVNGAGMSHTGQDTSLHYKNKFRIKKGEKAIVTFKCDACGYEYVHEIVDPWTQTLKCDCPEKIDEKGNAKEYTSISISFID